MPKKPPKGKNASEREIAKITRSSSLSVRKARAGTKLYSNAICDEIIMRVSDGITLSEVCRDEEMPSWMTVHIWMEKYPDFAARLMKAREMARLRFEDEALDLSRSREDTTQDRKLEIDTMFHILERNEEAIRRLNQPRDPKVIEASKDEGGAWRIAENGERVNPISDAIQKFRRKKGLAPSEQ